MVILVVRGMGSNPCSAGRLAGSVVLRAQESIVRGANSPKSGTAIGIIGKKFTILSYLALVVSLKESSHLV